MSDDINEQLVLICGESGTGKSVSLMNIPDQERWMYLNCEAGKRLPFRNKFKTFKITEPYQIFEAFRHALNNSDYSGIVIDTITFLMEMFESQYVLGSENTMKGWSDYQQFFKELMQDHVASSDKAVVILAHTRADYDEKLMDYRTSVPVKGALKNNGIEAYFSTVVSTKKVSIKDLDKYQNDLLNISEQEKELGYKHVFQTQITKATVGERIRSPMGLFTPEQTYIDNDAAKLLQHLREYYS
jgi:hypothetical protein